MTTPLPGDESTIPFLLSLTPPPGADDVQLAFYGAVVHHGLTCVGRTDTTPTSRQTVGLTADYFLAQIAKMRGTSTTA